MTRIDECGEAVSTEQIADGFEIATRYENDRLSVDLVLKNGIIDVFKDGDEYVVLHENEEL